MSDDDSWTSPDDPKAIAHRERVLAEIHEETLQFVMQRRPTEAQLEFWETIEQADVAAQLLIERDPNHAAARLWRQERGARLTEARARMFRIGNLRDASKVIHKIGGTH